MIDNQYKDYPEQELQGHDGEFTGSAILALPAAVIVLIVLGILIYIIY